MGVCFIRFTICSYSLGGVQLIFVILYLVYGCKLIQTLIFKKSFFQYYKKIKMIFYSQKQPSVILPNKSAYQLHLSGTGYSAEKKLDHTRASYPARR